MKLAVGFRVEIAAGPGKGWAVVDGDTLVITACARA
jgi:hypothetical protein